MLYRTMRAVVVIAGASLAFCFLGETRVYADFLYGQTLSIEVQDTNYSPPTTLPPIQFAVNNSVEVGVANYGNVVSFNLEVTDNSITFDYQEFSLFDTASFNGYIFRAISPGTPAFGSIVVDAATTLTGFSSSRLGLDSKDFYVNVSGLLANTGTVLKLDVAPAAVPEPASLVSFALGASGVFGYLWRRKRASLPVAHPIHRIRPTM